MAKISQIATTVILLIVYVPMTTIGSVERFHIHTETGDAGQSSTTFVVAGESSSQALHSDSRTCVACQMAVASAPQSIYDGDCILNFDKLIPSTQKKVFNPHTAILRKRGPPK